MATQRTASQATGLASQADGVVEPSPSIVQPDPDNCFRILLATDNHIGYAEKDPVRGQDAVNTFKEILEIAKEAEVDFILLAGDLFHENRPSRGCLYQTMGLLREFSMGDKPISFELLSDPMDGAAPGFSFPAVNYEDQNLNVGIPIFSIHGNHDDPQGTGPEGALCALDMLSVSGLLNYFGKLDLTADEHVEATADKGIRIKPVLLRKGNTHLAMYGVGNVRDARMHYELRSNRVKMFMPDGGDVGEDDWFNMLLVHQNRVKHGPQQSVPEGMFDDSIKLVVWGHEHDCRIWPEAVEGKPYYITQPGSSVATSLAPGEALQKHVGILSIQGTQFQISEIPLKTVRPFEFDEIELGAEAANVDNGLDLENRDSITKFLRDKVESLIKQAQGKWKESHPGQSVKEMMLPLIRLKVETSEAKEMINPVRFSQEFINRVANSKDILQYYRKKKVTEKKSKNVPDAPEDEMEDEDWEDDAEGLTTTERLSKLRMANLVKQYLQAQNLEVLVEGGLEDAVMRFVDKDDKDAIKDFVSDTLRLVGRDMKSKQVGEADVEEHMTRAKEHAASQWEERRPAQQPTKKKTNGAAAADSDVDSMAGDSMMEVDSDASFASPPPTAKGKGNKAAPAAAKGKAKAPAKKKKALFADDSDEINIDDDDDEDDDDEDEEEEEEEVMPAKKARAPAKAKAPAKAAAKAPAKKAPDARGKATVPAKQQSQLNFSRGKASASKPIELSDDE